MNYCEIKNVDIANGLGTRVSLFVSGCTHHCKGCFNKEAWDFNYGKPFTKETEEYLIGLLDKPYIRGLTILGGEPMEPTNQEAIYDFIIKFRKRFSYTKDIWIYSGYTFEELTNQVENRCYVKHLTKSILLLTNVLVDGEFKEELKDITLKFRGSSNQRIINPVESIEENKIVLVNL